MAWTADWSNGADSITENSPPKELDGATSRTRETQGNNPVNVGVSGLQRRKSLELAHVSEIYKLDEPPERTHGIAIIVALGFRPSI